MEHLTPTGEVIRSILPEKIKLDLQIKRVLACKPILAVILSETVDECKGMSYQEIESCIEGDVSVEEIQLLPTEMISGDSEEDFLPGEGMIRYDIRTYLRFPGKEAELSKILIDVEAQKDDAPGYSIAARGIFYCCRMISSQLNTEFTVSSKDRKKYDNIKKVYSIWICTETAGVRKNSIEKYSLNKEMIFGDNNDDKRYDLISAIIVNIGKYYDGNESGSKTLDVLSILLNDTMGAKEKIEILGNRYNVPLTDEIKKEVEDMCTYTTSIATEYEAKGKVEGEAKFAKLMTLLFEAGRNEDAKKAASNEAVRKKFYKEFGIID